MWLSLYKNFTNADFCYVKVAHYHYIYDLQKNLI